MVRLDFVVEPWSHHAVRRTSYTPICHADQNPVPFIGRQAHHRAAGEFFLRTIVMIVNRIITQAVHRCDADVCTTFH